jgi:Protein of unknown function (DUF2934)
MTVHGPSEKPFEGETAADPEQRIRERAHMLWEGEGRQEGRAEKYWYRAREIIDDEAQSAFPPAQSRGNRD